MAVPAGFYHFGGTTADFVFTATGAVLTLDPNTTLTIKSRVDGSTITNLYDSTGTAQTSVSTDSNGSYNFYAPALSVFINAGGPDAIAYSRDGLDAAMNTGSLASQVAAAQAAASSASTSATTAVAAANAAVPKTWAGALGGYVPLQDSTGADPGHASVSYMPSDWNNRLNALDGGSVGGSGTASRTSGVVRSRWTYAIADELALPAGSNTLVAGTAAPFDRCGHDLNFDTFQLISDQAGSTASHVDFQTNTGSGYASILGGSYFVLPAGATDSGMLAMLGTSPLVPAGTPYRTVLIDVAPPPSGGSGTVTIDTTHKNSGNSGTTTMSSVTAGVVTGAQGATTSGMMYVVLCNAGAATMSLPTPWVSYGSVQSTTPKVKLAIWGAPWTSSLATSGAAITNSGQLCYVPIYVAGANQSSPAPQFLSASAEGAGSSYAGTSGTASTAFGAVLYGCAVWYQNTGATGWSVGTPSGLTKFDDPGMTTWPTHGNLELFVGYLTSGAVTSGTALASKTYTPAGGTGTLTANSYADFIVGIPAAGSAPGPSMLRVVGEARVMS